MYFLDHYRTRISQVIGLLFLFLFMFSQKELDVTAPYISGILFLVGCLCVGAAMAGRMWCAQYIAGYKNDVLVREGPYRSAGIRCISSASSAASASVCARNR